MMQYKYEVKSILFVIWQSHLDDYERKHTQLRYIKGNLFFYESFRTFILFHS